MDIQKVRQGLDLFLEGMNGAPPARQMPNETEVAEIAAAVRPAWDRLREWHSGPIDPKTHRLLNPWPTVPAKVDTRSPELLALAAEVEQLDSEYQEAVRLWEKCVAEQINRNAPLATTATFQIVARGDARETAALDRRIETAAHLRDAAADKLQAARSRYYAMLRAEQAERRAAAQRAEQAAQLEARTRAAEAKKQSFAKDALEFFGIRA